MYYFKFNIGDYHKKAGRLSMLEHGAYTLLIHSCYDRERFPTEEEALDWCWARTDEEIQAVKFVLRKFFDNQDGRYVQARIQDEIDAYHGRQETNRAIALEREARKRTNRDEKSTKRERSVQDRTPNQEPLTKNQEPNSIDRFAEFWNLYPRKIGKPKAHASWKAATKLSESKQQEVLDGLKKHLPSLNGKEQQFIPHPTTWLNQHRWADPVEITKQLASRLMIPEVIL